MKATNGGGGNGADWNEEYRWDNINNPAESSIAIKLCTRLAPSTTHITQEEGGIKSLWRRTTRYNQQINDGNNNRKVTTSGSREEKAAAVAQFLMKEEGTTNDDDTKNVPSQTYEENREGLCLGTLIIPMSRLPLEDAYGDNHAAVVERWYQLEGTSSNSQNNSTEEEEDSPGMLHGPRRCPSVLLELTFASNEYLDGTEEEILDGEDHTAVFDLSSLQIEESKEQEAVKVEEVVAAEVKKNKPKPTEPELGAGIVDFVCIVGARDIGNQRNDDGSKGWVQSTPECCVLERFPPNDDFHVKNGRNVGLIPQAEWFCFPEGCKLWRGAEAPTHEDLRLGGVSTAGRSIDNPSPFDSCLGSASSFSWFVLSSNSDDYGSAIVKTYGVVVRFYVPAPKGIDPTQDDFAQTMTGGGTPSCTRKGKTPDNQKRLWVPIGICFSTTLPIVGVVEELLLRTCNAMASRISSEESSQLLSVNSRNATSKLYDMLQKDLFHLIVNFSKPIPGVVHTSIPFLEGDRLHVTTSPPNGLPCLPHGGAIAATCRLLGAEGLTLLLSSALTECKILIHSTDVANVAMVAEVISALIFPFTWQLVSMCHTLYIVNIWMHQISSSKPIILILREAFYSNIAKRYARISRGASFVLCWMPICHHKVL